MQFEKNDLKEFQKLWLEEFGEEIDDAPAVKEALRLLALIKFATTINNNDHERQ